MKKIFFSLGLGLYVGLFVYLSGYSGPSGDDYWMLDVLNNFGFWGTQVGFWFNWTSRFTTIFVTQLANLLGAVENYGWHVPIFVLFTLFALFFLFHTLFPQKKISIKLFYALLLQAVWLSVGFDLRQSLYWLSGSYYYWTCGFLIIEFALIVKIYRGDASKKILFLLGALLLMNSGVSELSAVYQVPMCLMGALACHAEGKRNGAKFLWIMFCVALAGVLIQLLNPGNSIRVAEIRNIDTTLYSAGKNPLVAFKVAVESGLMSSVIFFTNNPIIYAIFLFIPLFRKNIPVPAFAEKFPFPFKIWHIILFEIVTFCCFQGIGGYAMGNFLYPRAMSVMYWAGFAQWLLFFAFLYRNEKLAARIERAWVHKYKAAILVLALLLNRNFLALAHDYWIMPKYLAEFAARRAYMDEQRTAGNKNIIIPNFTSAPFLLERDSFGQNIPIIKRFPNASTYHGFDSVREVYSPLLDAARESEEAEMTLLRKLASEGDPDAQFLSALYLDPSERDWTSKYIKKNGMAAVGLYFMAAEQGHAGAREALKMLYNGGLRTDNDAEIIKWKIISVISPI